MTKATTNYIPGVCNINPAEIRKRLRIGYVGVAVLIVLVVLFIAMQSSWIIRLVAFAPAFLAATGFLQARNKFCVGFAGAGQQMADDKAIAIEDQSALKADAIKARMLNTQAFLIALGVTIVVALIPLG